MDKGMPYVGTKEAVTYDANATRVDDVAHPVDEVLTKVDEVNFMWILNQHCTTSLDVFNSVINFSVCIM